ncbi:MAG TPA: 50S ribosomal protein L21 [Terriglobales bacterium]|nr:50S ribosomal protein L21 [Terriglobales bacterium]
MYAVIRAGGKQYRVAPGDVIRIEKTEAEKSGHLEFTDVLAVSAEAGQIGRPQGEGARVLGHIVEQGRADKILVFHYKRKKQYKKLAGHRQPFTAVRITEIAFDGHTFTAPELPAKKEKKARPAVHAEPKAHKPEHKAEHKPEHKAHEKKAAPHKGEQKAAKPAKHSDKKSDSKHKKK